MNAPTIQKLFLIAMLVVMWSEDGDAAITWDLTYEDVTGNTGVGFDDPTHGAARQATFSSVLSYINTVVDYSATLDFIIRESQTDGNDFLASAGTYYFSSNGFSNGLLYQHATTGSDPTGAVEDGFATFDFGYTWNSELDTTTGSEFDLFTVALHEVTHAMGFASLAKENGDSGISDSNPGSYSNFDTFLERGDGTDLFSAGGNFDGVAADFVSDDLFFNGANAVAANGGNPVKIYAPGTYNDGSSISHVDTATYPTAVMNHAIAMGVEKRTYSALDIGILQDIGWNASAASAVPEPPVYYAIAVLGIIGWFRRKRTNYGSCSLDTGTFCA